MAAGCCSLFRTNAQSESFELNTKSPRNCSNSIVTHVALAVLATIALVAAAGAVLAFTGHLSTVTSFVNTNALWFAVGGGAALLTTIATGTLLSCKR